MDHCAQVPWAGSPSIILVPGGQPAHPAKAREVKLHFPDCLATRTCQLGEVGREAGVKHALGPWILAAPAPAARLGCSLLGGGVSVRLLCRLQTPGQSARHSRSYKYEAGAPSERAQQLCEHLRPGTKPLSAPAS